MLQSIYIQNYALIDKLDISFTSGFSVITGETGAGKSIILGAIGLLLGQRADVKAIKNGASKCIVEARFRIASYGMEEFFLENDIEYDPEECILRREVSANGKSRAFINDTPASLAQMKLLGEKLIDVHSQHQNLLLNKEGFQMNILDILAQDDAQLSAYQKTFQDLEEADLKEGEQASLEQEAETLSHSEDIKSGLYKAEQTINDDERGSLPLIKECMQTLQNISKVYSPAQEWTERLNSCYIELKDISLEVANAQEEVEFNPSRLDYVNERLNLIYSLQQKHRVDTVEELIALTDRYREQLNAITSFDDHIAELNRQKESLYNAKGMDSVVFLFSANKNGTLQNVASIASGGEIARVMLSLKAMIAGAVKLPTIIFDEIDTGVSGSIAEKMALIMQDMGRQNRQVISITHLPQIAARGCAHYKVYKEDTESGTNSHICRLTDEERVREIANMLSGSTMTEAALNNARALLGLNNNPNR